jgi:two-component system, sensor histidine kinase and response regulator
LLEVLHKSNLDMLALIQNLLAVYCYDAGAPPLDFTAVDVMALANTCIDQLTAIAEGSGGQLTSSFPEGNHTISADLIALRRVLMNLLSNGIKFTGAGGHVTVSGSTLGNFYVLEIKDTGAGIPKADVDKLFQKYSQGAQGKRYKAGTGLGLYLCRQLVEAHGGEITCTSTEGVGTTFRVTLPSEGKEHPH